MGGKPAPLLQAFLLEKEGVVVVDWMAGWLDAWMSGWLDAWMSG